MVRLQLDPSAKFLLKDSSRKQIEAALREQFGAATRLTIELTAPAAAAPAEQSRQEAQAAQQMLEDNIHSDPVVSAFREQFGATVRPGSIQPLPEQRDQRT